MRINKLGQYYKTFFSVTNERAKQARVFFHNNLFRPSLMYASQARAYKSEAPF
jgi:hypothetical protein